MDKFEALNIFNTLFNSIAPIGWQSRLWSEYDTYEAVYINDLKGDLANRLKKAKNVNIFIRYNDGFELHFCKGIGWDKKPVPKGLQRRILGLLRQYYDIDLEGMINELC